MQVIAQASDIDIVGHRVVHGGLAFEKSTLVTPEVKAAIARMAVLAPVHNPANLEGIESAYIMGVSGGGALAIDFTLEHPEMVDALIPVTAGVSGLRPSEEVMKKHPDVVRMYTSLDEAFEKHDIARAVEISLELWTDGPGRLPGQAAPDVRERVREMTTRNWERSDDEAQTEALPVPLEPPAVGRLSEIGVPTLVILGEWDGPNPLEHLATEIPGAKRWSWQRLRIILLWRSQPSSTGSC